MYSFEKDMVFVFWKNTMAWYTFHIENIYLSVLCQRELGWLQQSYEKELFRSLVPQLSDTVSYTSTKTLRQVSEKFALLAWCRRTDLKSNIFLGKVLL